MYIGRFAPSPTGPLHFGSLITAVGSYLEAYIQNGQWLVRIEDIDPPREQPGATDQILKTLEHFGFEWDGPVMYQSQHFEKYRAILKQLSTQNKTYPCICSRKKIAASRHSKEIEHIYPGTCRDRHEHVSNTPHSIRLRTTSSTICFQDLIQGQYSQAINKDVGDFNLQRRDGLYSYHLAVTVDDAEQNISHVVRGFDLIDSTPRQIYLQQQLAFTTPVYAHLPIAINQAGQKLSKQNMAKPIDSDNKSMLLWQALALLGQKPPQALAIEPIELIWEWAKHHWSLEHVPKRTTIRYHDNDQTRKHD